MGTKYRYTGKVSADNENAREFLPGIPARDLDDDDWEGFDAERRKAVRDSAIYEAVETKGGKKGGDA